MMAVDPTDDCTFWYTQEYYAATSTAGWQTRVGSFNFPNCPLTIANVHANNVNANSAVVTWRTNNSASSRVDYGTTGNYGSSSSDFANVTNHSMTISGLANNTTYHYKVTSTDTFDQTSTSSDATFATYTNLLNNGGFEGGGTGWTMPPQASIDLNPADAHSGNNSLQLVATAPWQLSWQAVPISAGQTYAFTGWGRSNAAGGVFTLVSYDGTWNEVGHTNAGFPATGNWVPVTSTFTAPAAAVRLVVEPQSSASGTFWFDDISLTRSAGRWRNRGGDQRHGDQHHGVQLLDHLPDRRAAAAGVEPELGRRQNHRQPS